VRPLVVAFRELLASAPDAEAFMRDWPGELIARPVGGRCLPVVAALQSLSRLAAPRTRSLVEGVAALADELDWRQRDGMEVNRKRTRILGKSRKACYTIGSRGIEPGR
jgi:hypothetical protein